MTASVLQGHMVLEAVFVLSLGLCFRVVSPQCHSKCLKANSGRTSRVCTADAHSFFKYLQCAGT